MNLRFVLQVVARTGWGCQGGLTGDGGFGDESAPSLVMELSTSSSEGGGRAGDGAGRSGRTPPPGRGVACTGEERADAAVATREGLRPASRNRRGRPPLPEYREEMYGRPGERRCVERWKGGRGGGSPGARVETREESQKREKWRSPMWNFFTFSSILQK
jgi:hypothetical protein